MNNRFGLVDMIWKIKTIGCLLLIIALTACHARTDNVGIKNMIPNVLAFGHDVRLYESIDSLKRRLPLIEKDVTPFMGVFEMYRRPHYLYQDSSELGWRTLHFDIDSDYIITNISASISFAETVSKVRQLEFFDSLRQEMNRIIGTDIQPDETYVIPIKLDNITSANEVVFSYNSTLGTISYSIGKVL